MITMLHKLGCCLCFIAISFTSCSGKSSDLVRRDSDNPAVSSLSSDEKLYYMDLNNPTIAQPIDAEKDLANAKFVRVEVVEVVNPRKLPLAFQIHYQSKTNEKIYLGSFGLYPADNPGKFIVATQGKVKREGTIIVSLVRPEQVEATDTIKVGIKKIRLVKGE